MRSRRRTGPAAITCAGSNSAASDTSAFEASSWQRWISRQSGLSLKRPNGAESGSRASATTWSSVARVAAAYGATSACIAGSLATVSLTVVTLADVVASFQSVSPEGRVNVNSTSPSASPFRPAWVTIVLPTLAD